MFDVIAAGCVGYIIGCIFTMLLVTLALGSKDK